MDPDQTSPSSTLINFLNNWVRYPLHFHSLRHFPRRSLIWVHSVYDNNMDPDQTDPLEVHSVCDNNMDPDQTDPLEAV